MAVNADGAHPVVESRSVVDHLRAYDVAGRASVVGGLAFVGVLALQIPYPLLGSGGQRYVTIWSVVAFFAASAWHAWWSRGSSALVSLVVSCAGGGLAVEALGSRVGVPFGNYRYTDMLGWRFLGVPVVVALAWAMFGWLALLCGQRVGGGWRGALVGGAVLTAWDLFLDPQMVRLGGWVWEPTWGPTLHGIPLVNFAGWFVVGSAMTALLLAVVPNRIAGRHDDLGWMLLGWTLFSETLLFAVFFSRPAVAAVGAPVMAGVFVLVWKRGGQR